MCSFSFLFTLESKNANYTRTNLYKAVFIDKFMIKNMKPEELLQLPNISRICKCLFFGNTSHSLQKKEKKYLISLLFVASLSNISQQTKSYFK
jgi:hypothetical protein